MNYYLKIQGSEYGPYTRDQIIEGIADGSISEDQPARLEGFPNWLLLSEILDVPPTTKPTAPVAGMVPVDSPALISDKVRVATYLEGIRSNSCYTALRAIITVCFILLLMGIATFVALGTTVAILQRQYIALIGLIASAFFSTVVLVATRQAAFLLVDIADTLLFEHSKQS